jgi:hypothetical protein
MTALYENDALNEAASNHSVYLFHHNLMSHNEDKMHIYFTGETPSQRCISVGYINCSENISFGNKNIQDSIDRLFSAIYHRFGFLDTTINEIGFAMGEENHNFVYNMGSNINITDEPVSSQNPKIVLWPPEQAKDIIPMFTKELPDPMPGYELTGYPISVQFNNYYYKSVEDVEIRLYDERSREIINTKFLDESSDPNGVFSHLQFALFPIDRLDWGSRYKVELKYKATLNDYSKEEKELSWNFWTRGYDYQYFIVHEDTKELKIRPNTNYTFYFIPKDSNDIKITKGIERTTQNTINMMDQIDYHTFNLNIGGPINSFVNIIKEDDTKIKLLLSRQDDSIAKNTISDEELMALQSMEELNAKIDSIKDNAQLLRKMGLQYYYGEGMKQDYQIAFRYLQLAAKLNDKDAQIYLSSMYFKGQGTEKDVEKSEYWNNKYLSDK